MRQIEVHAVELEISAAEAVVGRRRLPARVTYQPARETATLRFAESLPAGRATLRLTFRGVIGTISHPSPASPKANRGWSELVEKELSEHGLAELLPKESGN